MSRVIFGQFSLNAHRHCRACVHRGQLSDGPLQHPSPTRIRQQLQKWDIYGDHVIVDHIETLRKTCVLPLLIILIFAEIEQTAVVISVRSYQESGEFQDPAETERL